ncbi:MAG TPA: futalosine hydrolase [Longimicrobiaceae bacterium]|nr:futalosine hydrolase [Longimicrobiaceae bacterium]
MPDQSTLAFVCAVPLECEPLAGLLAHAEQVVIGRKRAWWGTLDRRPVILLPAGMGKTNAAQGITALLEEREVGGVIGFGVGGAYPGAGLEVGDVALATRAVYGDEGVQTPAGWISTKEIGIPLLERGGAATFNEIELDAARVRRAGDALERAGIRAVAGPFVTVSTCSGTAARGAELAARFGAVCESMEGAALAHVAALYQCPYVEVRGISNLVEDRDLARWRLREAADAAQRAARAVAAGWGD